MSIGSEYLFTIKAKDSFLSYERFARLVSMLSKELGLEKIHKGHDGRLTFTTLAKKYNVDEYVIKRVLGHRINDLTERLYCQKEGMVKGRNRKNRCRNADVEVM